MVTDGVMRDLLHVARWTGSARNRQPWRVAIVTARPERAELAFLGAYAAVLREAPIAVLLAIDVELGGADAEFDAGRFAQTLMLAEHADGLGSCPVSFFPHENARRATEIAGLTEPGGFEPPSLSDIPAVLSHQSVAGQLSPPAECPFRTS